MQASHVGIYMCSEIPVSTESEGSAPTPKSSTVPLNPVMNTHLQNPFTEHSMFQYNTPKQ